MKWKLLRKITRTFFGNLCLQKKQQSWDENSSHWWIFELSENRLVFDFWLTRDCLVNIKSTIDIVSKTFRSFSPFAYCLTFALASVCSWDPCWLLLLCSNPLVPNSLPIETCPRTWSTPMMHQRLLALTGNFKFNLKKKSSLNYSKPSHQLQQSPLCEWSDWIWSQGKLFFVLHHTHS